MKRIKVESSSIESIGYDRSELVLEVEFTRGVIYQYVNVYPDEVIDLIFAESVGKSLALGIKKRKSFKQVSE